MSGIKIVEGGQDPTTDGSKTLAEFQAQESTNIAQGNDEPEAPNLDDIEFDEEHSCSCCPPPGDTIKHVPMGSQVDPRMVREQQIKALLKKFADEMGYTGMVIVGQTIDPKTHGVSINYVPFQIDMASQLGMLSYGKLAVENNISQQLYEQAIRAHGIQR